MLETRVRTQATTDEGALEDAAVAAQEYFDDNQSDGLDGLNVIVVNHITGDEWEFPFDCQYNPRTKERTAVYQE